MKTSAAIILGVAVFGGVLGALQADHFIVSRGEGNSFSPILRLGATPASFEPLSSPTDFRAAAKKVMPSVVSVDRYERVRRGFFFDEEAPTMQETGTGSGVIVSESGIIVTNNHVVAGAQQVKVRTNDNHTSMAKVLGTDPRSDLAVLKIDVKNLSPIEMGESAPVEVGQWVLAVGNPLGFSNTVSVGVVSSLKRDLPVGNSGLVNAIQTDAAINPGNSGGALTDAQGKLIGINSAIASGTGQSVGIGFAIPVDRVKRVVNDIVKLGYVRYPDLGIVYAARYDGALADPEWRNALANDTGVEQVPSSGIIVLGVNGSAQKIGIQREDVVLEVDGLRVDGSFDLNKALVNHKPGDTVKVKYWTRGATKTASITLDEAHGQ